MLEEEEGRGGWRMEDGWGRESKNHNFRPSVRSPFRKDAHLAKPDDGGDGRQPNIGQGAP